MRLQVYKVSDCLVGSLRQLMSVSSISVAGSVQAPSASFKLEDDSCTALVSSQLQMGQGQGVHSLCLTSLFTTAGVQLDIESLPDDSLKYMFFGRPVEGNLAHHTVMGRQLPKFDFLVQPFTLIEAEWNEQEEIWGSVTVVQRGNPVACRLSHIAFDILSKNLKIWTSPQSGFRVSIVMWFG